MRMGIPLVIYEYTSTRLDVLRGYGLEGPHQVGHHIIMCNIILPPKYYIEDYFIFLIRLNHLIPVGQVGEGPGVPESLTSSS
jgi:hypothetical protein